jgi:hypothetical protein
LGELLVELGELLQMHGGVFVTQGTLGLAVEGLTAEPALLGSLRDVAVPSEVDTAGTGEPFERRYDTRG